MENLSPTFQLRDVASCLLERATIGRLLLAAGLPVICRAGPVRIGSCQFL